MDWREREKIARQRMSGEKWIVYDYYLNADGEYGAMEKCPKPIDYGFVHGFQFKNPIVPITRNLSHDFEINVYCHDYIEDETFENRSINVWHMFTSEDKAKDYAEKCKRLKKQITLDDVLKVVKTIPSFKDARISVGKRGYETNTEPYKVICCDYGWTTMNVIDNQFISVQMGQEEPYIIPHIDLLKLAFSDIDRHQDINYNYCEYLYRWRNFYEKKD